MLILCLQAIVAAAWETPPIELPQRGDGPVIASTAAELAQSDVASRVKAGDRALAHTLHFPSRGGQHNQWYQCERCQLGLKTIDDTHHRCTKCGKVYSGEPYDDVIFARKHHANLNHMLNAAWAWAVTGEQKYAVVARDVLVGYAKRYRDYPFHASTRRLGFYGRRSGGHLFEQTLNEASAMTRSIAPAYDLVYNAPALGQEDHQLIREGLIVPMLENIGKYRAGKNNWQTWHNAGMLWGGAVIGDEAWVRRAIADPGNGFVDQMRISVTDDGMWYENSWGYHFYTMSAMVQIVEGARRLGIDLWSHPRLRRMFTLPTRYAMPDGSLPRFGDDVNSKVDSASRLLKLASRAYGDENMLAVQPAVSEVFHAAGHAILRTTGDAGLAAAITFGLYGGYHGHLDKLSFVFFGHGVELGVDPGRARSQAYRLPIHKRWYKPTVSHNTVLMDRLPQAPAAGRIEQFAATPQFAAVVVASDQAYAGVTHERLLLMSPSYLLVVDHLTANRDVRFDWVYHNRGRGAETDTNTAAADPPDAIGFEYIKNGRTAATDKDIHVRFGNEAVTTHVMMAGAAATQLLLGDGPCGSVLDRVPVMMAGRNGRDVWFAATIEPVKTGGMPGVRAVRLERIDNGLTVQVSREGGDDRLDWPTTAPLRFNRQGRQVLAGEPVSASEGN